MSKSLHAVVVILYPTSGDVAAYLSLPAKDGALPQGHIGPSEAHRSPPLALAAGSQ